VGAHAPAVASWRIAVPATGRASAAAVRDAVPSGKVAAVIDAAAPTDPARFRATFPASRHGVGAVRREMAAFARACGLCEPAIEDVQLAVSEAVTNAIVHGYREGPGEVVVTAEADEAELVIVIADSGAGVQPRTDSPGLGLGLGIIRSVTSRMEVAQAAGGGAEILMGFPRPARAHETRRHRC
jgi:serine/threonine-protein kinase RsbW/stage II sporulation protein AB (anti-sigma F factor)